MFVTLEGLENSWFSDQACLHYVQQRCSSPLEERDFNKACRFMKRVLRPDEKQRLSLEQCRQEAGATLISRVPIIHAS